MGIVAARKRRPAVWCARPSARPPNIAQIRYCLARICLREGLKKKRIAGRGESGPCPTAVARRPLPAGCSWRAATPWPEPCRGDHSGLTDPVASFPPPSPGAWIAGRSGGSRGRVLPPGRSVKRNMGAHRRKRRIYGRRRFEKAHTTRRIGPQFLSAAQMRRLSRN
jgi:hypothetical protein